MLKTILDNWDYAFLIICLVAMPVIILIVALKSEGQRRIPILLATALTLIAPVFALITLPVAANKIPRTRLPIYLFLMFICLAISLTAYKSLALKLDADELLNSDMLELRGGPNIIINKHTRAFSKSITFMPKNSLSNSKTHYYEILPIADQGESDLRVFSYYYGFNKSQMHNQDKIFDKYYGFAMLESNVSSEVLQAIKDRHPSINTRQILILLEQGKEKVSSSNSFSTTSFYIFLALSMFFAFLSLKSHKKHYPQKTN